MRYIIRLEELRCHKSQELGGDEIYLKLNGQEIFSWKTIGKTFIELADANYTNAFDFRTCSYASTQGWQRIDAYTPDQFVYRGVTGEMTFELWESDAGNPLRGADDAFGALTLTPQPGLPRQQTLRWRTQGAYYELTCFIDPE